jgi:hypothetical protein
MKNGIISKIDSLISQYQKDHTEKPLHLVISREEGDNLINEIREAQNLPEDHVITTYKGIRIERSIAVKAGNFFLSNELPETGS